MKERHVVILTFPGMQSLDAVGPFETFAGATRVAKSLGSSQGYRITLASTDGKPVRAESGIGLCTSPLPGSSECIDTLVIPGGDGVAAARTDRALTEWIAAAAPRCR